MCADPERKTKERLIIISYPKGKRDMKKKLWYMNKYIGAVMKTKLLDVDEKLVIILFKSN